MRRAKIDDAKGQQNQSSKENYKKTADGIDLRL